MQYQFILFVLSMMGMVWPAVAQDIRQVPEGRPSTFQENPRADGIYRPVELGPHHRVMQKFTEVQGEDGFLHTVSNSYVELATGMHVWSEADRKWVEANDEIEIRPGHAAARGVQLRPSFAADLADKQGAIDLQPLGLFRLRSRPFAIAYTDANTGKSVSIAELSPSTAGVAGRDEVIYPEAFGELADVRYRVTRSTCEQDVLLRRQPPSPNLFALKPEQTRVEVWTEFLEAPVPNKRVLAREEDPVRRDEQLNFADGSIFFSVSQIFKLDGKEDPLLFDLRSRPRLRATKQWVVSKGRTFLVESMPYLELAEMTADLPKLTAKIDLDGERLRQLAQEAATPARRLPASVLQKKPNVAGKKSDIDVAQLKRTRKNQSPAVVIDYVLATGAANFTFKGDTTYYCSGESWYTGTTTIEGGSVIKYFKWNGSLSSASPRFMVNGAINCSTGPYRPAVFTAKDDDTVGEIISGSTGSPSGYYAFDCVTVWDLGTPVDMHDLRFRYALEGITFEYRQQNQLRHSQFVNCYLNTYTYQGVLAVRNILCQNFVIGVQAWGGTINCENATFNNGNQLFNNYLNSSSFTFTNTLAAAVTSIGTVTGSNNQILPGASGIFQTVGSGSHYLAASSPYRNAGTTALNPQLLADLKKRTTYPPIILTTDFTTSTTLAPQAQRDSDAPDLGYHYDPLDWCLSNLNVTNSTLTLTNGIAVGVYGSTGLNLQNGSALVSQGSPLNLNRLVRYDVVQEQPAYFLGLPPASSQALIRIPAVAAPQPVVQFGCTDVSMLANVAGRREFIATTGNPVTVSAKDSWIRGVYLNAYQNSSAAASYVFANNLFLNCNILWNLPNSPGYYPFSLVLYNNLFRRGSLQFVYDQSAANWTVQDDLFDCDSLSKSGSVALTTGRNGYKNGLVSLGGSNNKTGLTTDYQVGPLGDYYYPASGANLATLINVGSRTASAAGLFHYTVRTDQTKETFSTVDIGFHYFALNGSGLPADTDGDGIPDYLEDRNGNGTFDAGETDWQTSNSTVSGAAGLQVFTLLK